MHMLTLYLGLGFRVDSLVLSREWRSFKGSTSLGLVFLLVGRDSVRAWLAYRSHRDTPYLQQQEGFRVYWFISRM